MCDSAKRGMGCFVLLMSYEGTKKVKRSKLHRLMIDFELIGKSTTKVAITLNSNK